MTSWLVVGAGSAGCVVAARLSEDPSSAVVLLEAGPGGAGDDAVASDDFFSAIAVPGRTYPELSASRTLEGPPLPYLRGRGLGGSSAVNAMVAVHGDAALYESWGWTDTTEAWQRMLIPTEVARDDELGIVDHALLAAAPDATKAPLTRRDGKRVSAADAYLSPVAERANLVVRTDAAVERVLFEGRRAIGVRLVDGEELAADRVVLAAGALHSPALLLRSGVETAGVGEGLQDHPSVAFTLQLDSPSGSGSATGQGLATGSLLQRDGLQVLPLNHLGAGSDAAGYGVLLAAVMRPHGRAGTVRLDPHDPMAPPVVEFNLLADPRDLDQIASAASLTLGLLRRDAFRAIASAVYVDEHGTSWEALGDPERLVAWVGSATGGYVHASSTCAMGRVVDGDGRVVGYEQLLVCDASVFPSIPDVNTHLPTTMLAERLAARWRSEGIDRVARG